MRIPATLLLSLGFVGTLSNQSGAQPPAGDALKTAKFLGAGTCQQCHASPRPVDPKDFVLLNEYATWRTEDKHSLAYVALLSPRGQRMGELLGGDKKYVLERDAGCLNCHAMNFKDREGQGFSLADGVSCDGCHGPAEQWLTPHFAQNKEWRKKTPEQKRALGLRDLRDPVVRSELCMSCHVGNAEEGKVITHAMYAAGHPPLPPLEVLQYSRNLPAHFLAARDVPFFKDLKEAQAQPDGEAAKRLQKDLQYGPTDVPVLAKNYKVGETGHVNLRLLLAGGGVAFRDQVKFVADRADFNAQDVAVRWPELVTPTLKGESPANAWPQIAMGHSDCASCHHELKRPSWRQERGYGLRLLDDQMFRLTPGRPQVRVWPVVLFEVGLRQTGQDWKGLHSSLGALYDACNAQPFGEAPQLNKAARDAATWAHDVTAKALATATLDQAARKSLLTRLCELPADYQPDFDTARQIASAVQVLVTEGKVPDPQSEAGKALKALEESLDLWPTAGSASAPSPRRDALKKIVRDMTKMPLDQDKQYQDALRDQVRHDDLRAKVLEPKAVEQLSEIREKEMARTFERSAAYDPAAFKSQLRQLAALLNAK